MAVSELAAVSESAEDFDVAAFVVVRDRTRRSRGLTRDHKRLLTYVREPVSVAELGAFLRLPVGAVRALLRDLVQRGLVSVSEPRRSVEPDEDLLVALLNGLRAV